MLKLRCHRWDGTTANEARARTRGTHSLRSRRWRVVIGCVVTVVSSVAAVGVPPPPEAGAFHEEDPTLSLNTTYLAGVDEGAELAAQYLYRKFDAAGSQPPPRLPTLLAYHGYSRYVNGGFDEELRKWALKNGYNLVAVAVRGTSCSSGRWDFMGEREALDAAQVIEWITDQPWSNGKVAMVGGSYTGFSQLGVASLGERRPKGLVAIAPFAPISDLYRDVGHPGGISNTGFAAGFTALIDGRYTPFELVGAAVEPGAEEAQACSAHQLDHADHSTSPLVCSALIASTTTRCGADPPASPTSRFRCLRSSPGRTTSWVDEPSTPSRR